LSSKFFELYGKVIASKGVAPIPTVLFRYQKELNLTPQETYFVCNILTFRWTTREDGTTPSIREMAKTSGISERTLRIYKNSLSEKGYLKVTPRFNNTGQLTNAYDLTPLFEKMEQFIVAENEGKNFNDGTVTDEISPSGTLKVYLKTEKNIPSANFATPPAESAAPPVVISPPPVKSADPPAGFAVPNNNRVETAHPLQNLQTPLQNFQGRMKQTATEVDIAYSQAFIQTDRQINSENYLESDENRKAFERARDLLKSAGFNALGIEIDFLLPWIKEFPDEMVKYALQKTAFTNKNLYYAEGILESWKLKGISNLDDAIKESRFDVINQPKNLSGVSQNRIKSIRKKT